MHSKLQAALCLTHPPVAVYKTHQPPEGSLTAPEGSHGCVIALLPPRERPLLSRRPP